MSRYNYLLQLIKDGTPVNAATTNVPFDKLAGSAKALLDILTETRAGQALLLREQPLQPDMPSGTPVYYDSGNNVWKAAVAATQVVAGSLQLADSSRVLGIVGGKTNNSLGEVVIAGVVSLDLSDVIETPVIGQMYYLSAVNAGGLSAQPAGVSVQVLRVVAAAGQLTQVLVCPRVHEDVFFQHAHDSVELAVVPAGTAILTDGEWSIPVPDADVEGWLPADHAIFLDRAPAGAMFGYNLSVAAWANRWPPLDPYLSWNRGESIMALGMGVPEEIVRIDNYGIWWMSSCLGEVPWDSVFGEETTTTTTSE